MIARFVPATRQVYLLSIPRDLWVDIPGNVSGVSGENRINAAFDSGPGLLIETVEHDLHIPINHYVSVNFDGFQNMVQALGGIDLDFPTQLRDQYSGLDITETGCHPISGAQALELVRARHMSYLGSDGYWQYDGLSDFSRIQRQDAFFRAVLDKVSRELTNPFAINGFIGAAVNSLTIDDTIHKSDLVRWASEFHGVSSASLHTMTLPTIGFTTDGGAEVLSAAEPYADQMLYIFNMIGVPSKNPAHDDNAGTGRATTTTSPWGSGTSANSGGTGAAPASSTSLTRGPTTTSSTTTTIPPNVHTNTEQEPFNPTPCTA
jgi:LCP family protein required for cell wall assembly